MAAALGGFAAAGLGAKAIGPGPSSSRSRSPGSPGSTTPGLRLASSAGLLDRRRRSGGLRQDAFVRRHTDSSNAAHARRLAAELGQAARDLDLEPRSCRDGKYKALRRGTEPAISAATAHRAGERRSAFEAYGLASSGSWPALYGGARCTPPGAFGGDPTPAARAARNRLPPALGSAPA